MIFCFSSKRKRNIKLYIIEAKTQSIKHNLGYVTKSLQAENGKKFKQFR